MSEYSAKDTERLNRLIVKMRMKADALEERQRYYASRADDQSYLSQQYREYANQAKEFEIQAKLVRELLAFAGME